MARKTTTKFGDFFDFSLDRFLSGGIFGRKKAINGNFGELGLMAWKAPKEKSLSYLAVVMDLHSRQIVGWAMDKRMKKQLTLDALAMAYWHRKPPIGLLHHSDREASTRAMIIKNASERTT